MTRLCSASRGSRAEGACARPGPAVQAGAAGLRGCVQGQALQCKQGQQGGLSGLPFLAMQREERQNSCSCKAGFRSALARAGIQMRHQGFT